MEIKLRKAGSISSELYQMNFGTKRWYWISRKNMVLDGSVAFVRNLFNALLLGLTVTVKGSYSRKCRRLTLRL